MCQSLTGKRWTIPKDLPTLERGCLQHPTMIMRVGSLRIRGLSSRGKVIGRVRRRNWQSSQSTVARFRTPLGLWRQRVFEIAPARVEGK